MINRVLIRLKVIQVVYAYYKNSGKSIKAAEVVAFEDLGPEAIRKLTVEDFPVIVAIDDKNGNLYNR